MARTADIVQSLWNLRHVLRDDGITYHPYVTELTWLLFLKMAAETGAERELPEGWRWADLERHKGVEQLVFYRRLLLHLGTETKGRIQQIYADPTTGTTVKGPTDEAASALLACLHTTRTTTSFRRGMRRAASLETP